VRFNGYNRPELIEAPGEDANQGRDRRVPKHQGIPLSSERVVLVDRQECGVLQ